MKKNEESFKERLDAALDDIKDKFEFESIVFAGM